MPYKENQTKTHRKINIKLFIKHAYNQTIELHVLGVHHCIAIIINYESECKNMLWADCINWFVSPPRVLPVPSTFYNNLPSVTYQLLSIFHSKTTEILKFSGFFYNIIFKYKRFY